MKNILLIIFICSYSYLFAQSSDSINLNASVSGTCSVDIDNPSHNVDLIGGEDGLSSIAVVSSESNYISGYFLYAHYTNGGNMKNGSHLIPLSMHYNSALLVDSGHFFLNTNQTLGTPDIGDLFISVAPNPSLALVSGSYSENLMIDCVPKSM
jgi:hypothetical protein